MSAKFALTDTEASSVLDRVLQVLRSGSDMTAEPAEFRKKSTKVNNNRRAKSKLCYGVCYSPREQGMGRSIRRSQENSKSMHSKTRLYVDYDRSGQTDRVAAALGGEAAQVDTQAYARKNNKQLRSFSISKWSILTNSRGRNPSRSYAEIVR